MRASSNGRGRKSPRSAAIGRSSSAESHAAWDGAYFVCVEIRSRSGAPASKSRLTCAFSSGCGSRSTISTVRPVARSKAGMRS